MIVSHYMIGLHLSAQYDVISPQPRGNLGTTSLLSIVVLEDRGTEVNLKLKQIMQVSAVPSSYIFTKIGYLLN